MDANKWIKEFVGIPSYLSMGFLGVMLSNGNIIIVLLMLIVAAAIYNGIYEMLFPGWNVSGKYLILSGFFLAQIAFWALVFTVFKMLAT